MTKEEGGVDSEQLAADRISLKLILVSGRTHEFTNFGPSTTAAEIINYVFEQWPREWEDERVSSAQMLKLIFHGRFLHGSVTLGALTEKHPRDVAGQAHLFVGAQHMPIGTSTVMHLVTRETLPEPNSSDTFKKSKSGRCCHCSIC